MLAPAAIWLIRLYQRTSSFRPPSCRFTPTCSQYAIDAISRYGFVRGSAMGAWRILRCHPFSRGGYDPVLPHPNHSVAPSDPQQLDRADA